MDELKEGMGKHQKKILLPVWAGSATEEKMV